MCLMPKTTRLNLRITEDFRREIELLADYHGLTLSSIAHSLLVKAVRREMQELDMTPKQKAPVVARISSGQTKEEIERDFRKTIPLATSSKTKLPMLTGQHKPKKQKKIS